MCTTYHHCWWPWVILSLSLNISQTNSQACSFFVPEFASMCEVTLPTLSPPLPPALTRLQTSVTAYTAALDRSEHLSPCSGPAHSSPAHSPASPADLAMIKLRKWLGNAQNELAVGLMHFAAQTIDEDNEKEGVFLFLIYLSPQIRRRQKGTNCSYN
jgi:hypothetical protein